MSTKRSSNLPHRVIEKPSKSEAYAFLDEGIRSSCMVILVAPCKVDYDGRARSHLPLGERLIILKPDGSLLIHTSRKYTPVNWQPPGCRFRVDLVNDQLTITSKRHHPLETVRIFLAEVTFLAKFALQDDEQISVFGSEADIVDLLQNNPELIEDGFKVYSRERTTETGDIDILGTDKDNNLVVVEVKRRRASHASVHQLKRYVDTLERKKPGQLIRGILLAPAITDKARQILIKFGLEYHRLVPNVSRDFDVDKQTKLV